MVEEEPVLPLRGHAQLEHRLPGGLSRAASAFLTHTPRGVHSPGLPDCPSAALPALFWQVLHGSGVPQ